MSDVLFKRSVQVMARQLAGVSPFAGHVWIHYWRIEGLPHVRWGSLLTDKKLVVNVDLGALKATTVAVEGYSRRLCLNDTAPASLTPAFQCIQEGDAERLSALAAADLEIEVVDFLAVEYALLMGEVDCLRVLMARCEWEKRVPDRLLLCAVRTGFGTVSWCLSVLLHHLPAGTTASSAVAVSAFRIDHEIEILRRIAELAGWSAGNVPEKEGREALMGVGSIDGARMLLDMGADVTEAMVLVCYCSRSDCSADVVALMLQHGARAQGILHDIFPLMQHYHRFVPLSGELTALHAYIATHYGDPNEEIVDLLLENGADVNFRAPSCCYKSVLSLSIKCPRTMEMLIRAGADVNGITKYRMSELSFAASEGQADAVRLLLEHGADIHAMDEMEDYALNHAAGNGQVEIISLLLDRGADVNAHMRRSSGTALYSAASKGHLDCCLLLLSRGAVVNLRSDGRLFGVLSAAAKGGHLEVLKVLLRAAAPVSVMKLSNTLGSAAKSGNAEMAAMLLAMGADVNGIPGNRPLLEASWASDGEALLELLLVHGADVNHKEAGGYPALARAARFGRVQNVRLLLEYGAAVNAPCGGFGSALIRACMSLRNQLETVQLLLQAGASTTPVDRDGKTALDHARERNATAVVALLESH